MNNAHHDALFIPCQSFGGGWIVPQSDKAKDYLESFLNGPPDFLAPIGVNGYIVEPTELEDIAHYARAHDLSIQLEA